MKSEDGKFKANPFVADKSLWTIFMILFLEMKSFFKSHPWLLIPGFIMLISMYRGFINSLKSTQSQDLKLIFSWLKAWLHNSHNPYLDMSANYNPHGIVFLSPLAFFDISTITIAWALFNVLLAPLASFLVLRMMEQKKTRVDQILFVLLFMSWAGLRVGIGNGQMTLFVFTAGLLGVYCCDQYPLFSGCLFAIAFIKPHTGLPFILWIFLTRKFKSAISAAILILSGSFVFCLRLLQSPLVIFDSYVAVLRKQFSGASFVQGHFELRPLMHSVFRQQLTAELSNGLISIFSLGAIFMVCLKHQKLRGLNTEKTLLVFCTLWSLSVVFHGVYDVVMLLLPVAALMPNKFSLKQMGCFVFGITQALLILDISDLHFRFPSVDFFSCFIYADRILVFGLFIYFLSRLKNNAALEQC